MKFPIATTVTAVLPSFLECRIFFESSENSTLFLRYSINTHICECYVMMPEGFSKYQCTTATAADVDV